MTNEKGRAALILGVFLRICPPYASSAGIKRYTMDQVWTATANFSAYLDPDDLRPAFHGKLDKGERVTVRLLPLGEEQLDESKKEFVERITALSRQAGHGH